MTRLRVLVTRPQPAADRTAAALRAAGHDPVVAPVMRIRPTETPLPDLTAVQAVICTSANAVRVLSERTNARDVPLFAVGAETAREAHAQGFETVMAGPGDARGLARLVEAEARPENGPLLHLHGAVIALDIAEALAQKGFLVASQVLYEAVAEDALPAAVRSALVSGLDAVLLFSARSARVLIALIEAAGETDACRTLHAVCMSEAVAEAARRRFEHVTIADHPTLAAMLAALPR